MANKNRVFLTSDWDNSNGSYGPKFKQPDGTSWSDQSEQTEGGLVGKTVGVLDGLTDEQLQALIDEDSVEIQWVEKYDDETGEVTENAEKTKKLSAKKLSDLKKKLPDLDNIVLKDQTPEEILKVLKDKWKQDSEDVKFDKRLEKLDKGEEEIVIEGKKK